MENNFSKPEDIKLIYTTNTMRPVKMKFEIRCFYCENKI